MGRLLVVLALALVGLVLPTGPAAACSCVGLDRVVADEPEVAFVGVLRRQVSDDSKVVSRLEVEQVFAGEVHRTQDVVSSPDGEAACGVEWPEGSRVLVMGSLDEESRITTNLCSSAVEGDDQYDATVASLVASFGDGEEPVADSDLVEADGWRLADWAWVRLVVALVGLVALALLARRTLRSRRPAR